MIRTSRLSLAMAGLLVATAAEVNADLVALQYHHVSDSTPSSTSTSVSLFEGQLDLIEELGLEVVSLKTGTEDALNGDLEDSQQIAITFDDAYDSVYHTAAPLLEAKGYPYTVFVNTDAIGRRGYMTWEQLEEFRDDKSITIANHTKDHAHLVQLPNEPTESWRDRVKLSLDGAQRVLKEKLGVDEPMLAYPYGEYSEAIEHMLDDRGWYGFGQQSGAIGATSHGTRLPRFPLANPYGQLNNLKTKLTSKALPVEAKRLPDGVMSDNPPTLSFTLPATMEANRLSCFASGQGSVDFEVSEDNAITVEAPTSFDSRRFRYNCTYPAGKGTFYWLSQQWLDLSQPED